MAGPGNNSGGGMKFMKFSQDRDDKSETKGQGFFMMMEKQNGVWGESERYSNFEGQLVKMEFKTYPYEGNDIDTVILYLEADGITYKISMNYNYNTRSVFNSLLGNPEYVAKNPLVISTYLKDGYGKIWTGKNTGTGIEHALNWKYQVSELPEVKKVRVGNTTVQDDSELNEFFKAWLKHIFVDSGILKGVTETTATEQAQAPAPSNLPPTMNQASAPAPSGLPPKASGPGQSASLPKPAPYNRPNPADLPDPNDDLPF